MSSDKILCMSHLDHFYDTFIVLLNIEIFCHDLSLLHEKMSTKYVFYKKL